MTLGNGFVANHLPYSKIQDRIPLAPLKIYDLLSFYHPQVLVNCLGTTGRPNIDWCQLPENQAATYMGNVILPALLGEVCGKLGIHLIHLGSGCIFYGTSGNCNQSEPWTDRGWKETDLANPLSYYSKTKYASDLLLGEAKHITTLRLRMPISDQDHPRNLINKLLGYKKVINIPNSMTLMSDLIRCIDWAANNQPGGIFHVVNPEPLTAWQIVREYRKYVPEHRASIMDEDELNDTTIARRSNCLLDGSKLQSAGFSMSNSREGLEKTIAIYVRNLGGNNGDPV